MVKPVTPKQCIGPAPMVDKIIEKINKTLMENYVGRPVEIPEAMMGDERARERVIRDFEAAGWQFLYVSDQREGCRYYVSAKN